MPPAWPRCWTGASRRRTARTAHSSGWSAPASARTPATWPGRCGCWTRPSTSTPTRWARCAPSPTRRSPTPSPASVGPRSWPAGPLTGARRRTRRRPRTPSGPGCWPSWARPPPPWRRCGSGAGRGPQDDAALELRAALAAAAGSQAEAAAALLERAERARVRGEPGAADRLAEAGLAALPHRLAGAEAALEASLPLGPGRENARSVRMALVERARAAGDAATERSLLAGLVPLLRTGERPAALLRLSGLARAAGDLGGGARRRRGGPGARAARPRRRGDRPRRSRGRGRSGRRGPAAGGAGRPRPRGAGSPPPRPRPAARVPGPARGGRPGLPRRHRRR